MMSVEAAVVKYKNGTELSIKSYGELYTIYMVVNYFCRLSKVGLTAGASGAAGEWRLF